MTQIDWIARWTDGRIGFHEGRPNVHLVAHFERLGLTPGARVFVPLCGKSVDMHWLLGAGYKVAGAEMSELAVDGLFEDLGVVPEISDDGALKRYSADGIDVFLGDLFDLTAGQMGQIDAVYDRAAYVAMPPDMRGRYAAQVVELAGGAPQLLITYQYDESLMDGPPFHIPEDEVTARHAAHYRVEKLGEQATGGVNGVPADEHVWLLKQLDGRTTS